MNFLSHFYFDRYSDNPERIIGMVLPDLVKNARKDWCIRPEKHQYLFTADKKLNCILEGWKRHLEVDRYFHSSDFFHFHTQKIKALIGPFLINAEVRPSFVAHIALELMLDSLLLKERVVGTNQFYKYLSEADVPSTKIFLELNGISDTTQFFTFLDEFISSAYLNQYNDSGHIIYAIGRICMRLWTGPFSDTQKLQLTAVLLPYMEKLEKEYMEIFDQIERRLNPYT
ncbi:hypothetical protein BDE36_4027 [Arcticibacter tournemirensis]|uniref:DUF479 domain-containing protein n=1 Tax=Arcticibacter tournemirensis TaxID=699437 RepID=A0A5M9H4P5_9SPHI|nr:hypothetical protein [Arcticibacter tournemirensis]KAA8481893.1 hypothetical protein F1649_13330 [Arcticibacter tournemirensis]TQM52224.1 hypothetical protein BDE36_4027 [Arcticibacter tournemirensis]